MPSRLVILTIIFFWLVSTTWLFVREVVPLFRTGEPPAFFTDVIDEVGGTRTTWSILHKNQMVGGGYSQVQRRADRTFKLYSEMIFKEFPFLNLGDIRKFACSYQIDRNGNLQELNTEVKIAFKDGDLKGDFKGELKGIVHDGMLTLRVFLNDEEKNLGPFQPQPLPVAIHGNVLNTMHMLNKIPGLRVGRTWQVPLLDPLAALPLGQKSSSANLIAEVHQDEVEWQGEPVNCFRIDYKEPGKKATAHTWVRRSDSLVLMQKAQHNNMDLVLVREVNK